MANFTLDDARILNGQIYNRAKVFWTIVLTSKLGSLIIGIATLLNQSPSPVLPGIIILFLCIGEYAQWQSDGYKAQAESMLRKVELADGFGWTIPALDIADHVIGIKKKTRDALRGAAKDNYFASKQPVGPLRALTNLRESAWWTKHLAMSMAKVCCTLTTLTLLGCFVTLYVELSIDPPQKVASLVAKVVAGVLSGVISIGLIKLSLSYFKSSISAGDAERLVRERLKAGAPSEAEALRFLQAYQITRASAPMTPNILWRIKRDDLNELWNEDEGK